MLLVIHIVLALASLPLMAAALLARLYSRHRSYPMLVHLSEAGTAGVVVTGTALVLVSHSSVTSACIQGVSYLVGMAVLFVAYKKLALAS